MIPRQELCPWGDLGIFVFCIFVGFFGIFSSILAFTNLLWRHDLTCTARTSLFNGLYPDSSIVCNLPQFPYHLASLPDYRLSTSRETGEGDICPQNHLLESRLQLLRPFIPEHLFF